MSIDKYSNDHTIEVDQGGGQLTVNANLDVIGSLEVSNIELTEYVDQVIRIPGFAFKPAGTASSNSVAYTGIDYSEPNGNYGYLSLTANPNQPLLAPICGLPHGAELTDIKAYVRSQDLTDKFTLNLVEISAASGARDNASYITDQSIGGVGNFLFSAQVIGTRIVDYSASKFYFFEVTGVSTSSLLYLKYADLVYRIKKFPQDTNSSPT